MTYHDALQYLSWKKDCSRYMYQLTCTIKVKQLYMYMYM